MKQTVIAWIATCGSLFPIRFIIERRQSFAFLEFAPALSQISIIMSHCSVVLFSLVAFSRIKKTIKESLQVQSYISSYQRHYQKENWFQIN